MPNLKQYSYKNYPTLVEIYILDQDVTLKAADLGDVNKVSDYPDLTEYRVGECTFTLNDDTGEFSPNNDNNFFVKNGYAKNGYKSPVEIKTGFLVNGVRNLETLFKGNIIRASQSGRGASIEVECVDSLQSLILDKITDFGIQRNFGLAHDPTPESSNGEYPVLPAVLPAAEGSAHITTALDREDTTEVDEIATEGFLNDSNYVIEDNKVITEGGVIENVGVGYPQIELKSPYRHKTIQDIISDVLSKYSITDTFIELPEQEVDPHFSSNGRVGYDVLGISQLGTSNPASWNGYVTDVIYNATEDKVYLLINVESNNLSSILEYDIPTRTYNTIYRAASAGIQFWKFAMFAHRFFIMTTTGSPYDSKSALNTTSIIRLNTNNDAVADFVASSESLKPQVAHYYGFGNRMFPDSRRSMIWYDGGLYYAYVDNSNDTFGVARATNMTNRSVIISANMDGNENHAGISFNIVGDMMTGDITFKVGIKSRVVTFKKDLS